MVSRKPGHTCNCWAAAAGQPRPHQRRETGPGPAQQARHRKADERQGGVPWGPSGGRGIALAGAHPKAHLAHGPEGLGIEANEALAGAIAAHGEQIGLGAEGIRAEFNVIVIDANNLKDGVVIGVVHRDAGLEPRAL